MKKAQQEIINEKIRKAGYQPRESNNSCPDAYCVEVWDNGFFFCEPQIFNDGTVQVELELFDNFDAFALRIFEYKQESMQVAFSD